MNCEIDLVKVNCEIDFVVNKGSKRYYIQSALNIEDPLKSKAELRLLMNISDFIRKIVVARTCRKSWSDDSDILHIDLYEILV